MEIPIEPNEKLNSVAKQKETKLNDEAALVNSFCNRVSQEYKDSPFWPEYLKDRALWYIRAARRNKRFYHTFTVLAMTLPLIVTVITSIDGLNNWRKWISAILSTLVAICSFLVGHFRHLEHWTNYRSTIESILREMNKFTSKAGCYKSAEGDDAVRIFAERVDRYIGDEQAKWCEWQKKNADEKSVGS